MSVFSENHGRNRAYESDAPPLESKISGLLERRGQSRSARREREDPPMWGFSYDRAEGVIHLLLAFSIVGGAAAILSSGLFAPEVAQARKVEARAALPAPLAPQQRAETQPLAQPKAQSQPAPPPSSKPLSEAPADARSAAPMGTPEKAAMAPVSLLDSRPLTEIGATPAKAPEPLAPPPASLREKLDPGEEAMKRVAVAAPPPVAETAPARVDEAPPREEPSSLLEKGAQASKEEAKSEDRGRMAHCYLKLSGRVQSSGSCRVRRTEDSVILELPGKPLQIAHAHGRVWTATLGGRSLGRVYRSGACWGARGFYACENG